MRSDPVVSLREKKKKLISSRMNSAGNSRNIVGTTHKIVKCLTT